MILPLSANPIAAFVPSDRQLDGLTVADHVVLSLDPSSRCMGYALGAVNGLRTELIEAGKITGGDKKAPALRRIIDMMADLDALIVRARPNDIIIESPAVQTPYGTIRDKDGKVVSNPMGQALYGSAVGVMLATCARVPHTRLQAVPSDVWTRGRSKTERAAWVQAGHPGYDPKQDKGGDVSDAIALMDFWNTQRIQETL